MAIASLGTRGTSTSATNNTTLTATPSAIVTAGTALILHVAQNGDVGHSISDQAGNPWELLGSYAHTAGNARVDVWLSLVENQMATNNTITVSFTSSVQHKSLSMWGFSIDAGNTLVNGATPVGNQVTAANGFGSASFASLSSKQRLYFRSLAKQVNTQTAITATTNFTTLALTLRTQNNANTIAQRGEFRINTSTGETSNPTLNVSGNTAGLFLALEEAPLPQTLLADLYENEQTFYAATVSAAAPAQDLFPALYTNEQVFYSATVSAGAQSLLPGLYTNNQTFYAATVGRGAVTVSPNLYSNGQVFYAPTITTGAVALLPNRYDNAQTFYTHVVSLSGGPQIVSPDRYDNAQVFYGPTVVQGALTLAPARYDNAQTFYAPAVTTSNTLTAVRYDNETQFYTATVSTTVGLTATRYDNTSTVYAPNVVWVITFPDWVEPGHVEPGWVEWPYFNTNQFFGATVTGSAVDLEQATRFDNTSVFYTHRVRFPSDIPAQILQLLTNRQELDPVAGTFTVYDDDGVTPLWVADAWADAAGTIRYSGKKLSRIDRLELQ